MVTKNQEIIKIDVETQEMGFQKIVLTTNSSRVSEKMIYKWWRNNCGLPKPKTGRKPKTNEEVKKILVDYAKKSVFKTQNDMSDYIRQEIGLEISQPTISRLLKSEGITRKKISYRYSEQEPIMEEIKKFIKYFKSLCLNLPILALDEASFHLNEAPRFGYAEKGSRAVSYRPGNKGKNITLILCIEIVKKKGVFSYELIEGGLETKSFHDFLSRFKLADEKDYYLLMDNLPVHRAKQSCLDLNLLPINELLKSKRVIPIYLPPYTPQLNPVELCFNFLRQNIEKHQPRTIEELRYFMDKAMVELNKKDLRKYLKSCLKFYSKKKQK